MIAHQMGGFDPELARRHFAIPDDFVPMTMIAVGYPGDIDDLPPERLESEAGPRKRRPVTDFAFHDAWQAAERTA